MSISAIPSSLSALSLTLSQLQDGVSVIAAASQDNSAVTSQAVVASSQGQSPAVLAAAVTYGPSANYSTGVVVGNSLNITA